MNDENGTTDSFEDRLRALMHAATDGLEPSAATAEVLATPSQRRSGPRTWVRLTAGGLVAAALVGTIVLTTRSGDSSRINSPASSASVVDETSPEPTAAGPDPTTGSSVSLPTSAKNFLVVGTDNGACIDPASPFADGIGDRTTIGERSDTMMVIRIDPATKTAGMLSFPRDLWVPIFGGNKSRLNSAFVDGNPQRLIDTIYMNFGIAIDHFVQLDFCAFKAVVDAVGGVTLAFDQPVRDWHTGLDVPEAGCFTFDGDHALAFVRSRYYETQDAAGAWHADPTSDLGRIVRQQALVRAVIDTALDLGVGDLDTARQLIDAVIDDAVIDSGLTIAMMLDYFGVLAQLDPAAMSGFQIAADGRDIGGNSVLVPRIDSPEMIAVLEAFRGDGPMPAGSSAPSVPPATSTPAETPDGSSVDTVAPPETVDTGDLSTNAPVTC